MGLTGLLPQAQIKEQQVKLKVAEEQRRTTQTQKNLAADAAKKAAADAKAADGP